MATDLAVRVASTFDAAGFNKAEKGIDKLNQTASKLAKTLGIALSVGAITAFGKSSVEAFLSAEKANARLGKVVDNLGLGIEKANIQGMLEQISLKAGIAGEDLVNAYQPLIEATRNAADSQALLALAMDVSAGSGVELTTVSDDLAAAYRGNFKALKKYNLGVSDAELKTMKFSEVAQLLNKQFKGSQAKYLETYAGKMAVLGNAAGTAKETIGKGLVDALMAITGSVDVESLSQKLIGFAQNLADAFVKIGNLIAQNWAWVKNLGIAIIAIFTATKIYAGVTAFLGLLGKIKQAWKDLRAMATGAALAEEAALNPLAFLVAGGATIAAIVAGVALLDKLMPGGDETPFKMPDFNGIKDPTFSKTEAEKLKLAKLNAKLAADEAKRKKAAALFDMNQIQLIAALKGNLSNEDRNRLELQLALATQNTDEVTRLTKQIATAQGLSKELTNYILDLPEAQNPFVAWKGYLDEIELQAKRIAAFGNAGEASTANAGLFSTMVSQGAGASGGFSPVVAAAMNQPIQVTVEVDGKAIADAIVNQEMSGNNAYLNRRLRGFD